jgi:Zn-dependent peptidase ImmA (M78 family)
MEGQQLPEDQSLERASNRFAAATLMPREEFFSELSRYSGALEGDEERLRLFSQRIKVSPEAILRRLLTFRRVSLELYRRKRRGWMEHSWYKFPESSGGPPIETRVLSSAGRSFVSLVVEGYQRNAVSSSSVSDYLGIQLKFLPRIVEAMTPAPGSLGQR